MQTIDVNYWKNLKIKDALSELSTTENGLSSSEAQKRLSKYGYNEIPEKKQRPIIKFLKTFYGPIPFMLIAVIVISFFLSKDIDAYIVIGLLLFNSIAAFAEEYKADNTLELLKKKLSVSANVIRDGKWQTIAARELVPGDIIRIRMGSIVPADAKIIESNYLSVDQSALTGESLPITAKEGDVIYSSSIIKGGEATALVISTGQNTFFGKTANLVSVARSKTHLESAIMRLIRYLIIIDVGLVAAVIIYALTINEGILTIIPFALLILLASVPVALPAAFTVAMAYGTERLSSKNILITKLESIEEASTMNVVCLDKTGTITKNQLAIEDPIPMTEKTVEEVIKYAAFASRKEDQDQIDLAVLEGVQKYKVDLGDFKVLNFVPFDPNKKLSSATVSIEGTIIEATKGEPNTIMSMCNLNEQQKLYFKDKLLELSKRGFRTVAVAYKRGDDKAWNFVGLIPLNDEPREDSKELISELKNLGLKVKMLTGDNEAIAKEIATRVGIGDKILNVDSLKGKSEDEISDLVIENDGFAGVFPEDKYMIVKALQRKGYHVGMTGDGVNDAPALKQAEVGIAVYNATDVAKNAADIVLTSFGVKAIVDAVKESRSIFERMISYTLMKIAKIMQIAFFLSGAFLVLGFLPISTLQLILMIFLNDIGSITLSTDNEQYSNGPDTWDVKSIFTASFIFSIFLIVEAAILTFVGLNIFKLNHLEFETFLFVIFAVSIEIIKLSIRERKTMWNSWPSIWVSSGLVVSVIISLLLAYFGILMTPISLELILMIVGISMAFLLLTDITKVLAYKHFAEFKDL